MIDYFLIPTSDWSSEQIANFVNDAQSKYGKTLVLTGSVIVLHETEYQVLFLSEQKLTEHELKLELEKICIDHGGDTIYG